MSSVVQRGRETRLDVLHGQVGEGFDARRREFARVDEVA